MSLCSSSWVCIKPGLCPHIAESKHLLQFSKDFFSSKGFVCLSFTNRGKISILLALECVSWQANVTTESPLFLQNNRSFGWSISFYLRVCAPPVTLPGSVRFLPVVTLIRKCLVTRGKLWYCMTHARNLGIKKNCHTQHQRKINAHGARTIVSLPLEKYQEKCSEIFGAQISYLGQQNVREHYSGSTKRTTGRLVHQSVVALRFEKMCTLYQVDKKFAYKNSEMHMKRNRETYAAFQTKIKCSSQMMHTFLSHICVCSVIIRVIFCLRCVEIESRFFCVRCTHCFHDFAYSIHFYVYYMEKFGFTQPLPSVSLALR